MKKVRITVKKIARYEDLMAEYEISKIIEFASTYYVLRCR